MLLAKWTGGDSANFVPQQLKLKIKVLSEKNEVLAESEHDIFRSRAFKVTGTAKTKAFRPINYAGTIQFDSEKMIYKMDMFLVELKPAAAAFRVEIPIHGSFEAVLIENNQKNKWVLSIR